MKSYTLYFLFLILAPLFTFSQIAIADTKPFQLSIMEKARQNDHVSTINIIQQPTVLSTVDLNLKKTTPRGGFGRGAWIGAAIGSVAGGIIGYATYKPCTGWGCILGPSSRGDSFVVGVFSGAFTGAILGGVTGIIIKLNKKKRMQNAEKSSVQ